MKKLFLFLLLSFPIYGMREQALSRIPDHAVHAPSALGRVNVFHDGESFHVAHHEMMTKVATHDTDALLRKVTAHQLSEFVKKGYLSVHQMDDGSLAIKGHVRGLGGGPGGAVAGSTFGFWLVHGISYGIIGAVTAGVTLVAGPVAGGAFGAATLKTAAPFITIAAKTVAVATGVAGAVATGPV